MEKTVTYNMLGKIDIAIQKGTDKIDVSDRLEKTTTLFVKGNGFEAQIVIMPKIREDGKALCRIGLVIKNELCGANCKIPEANTK